MTAQEEVKVRLSAEDDMSPKLDDAAEHADSFGDKMKSSLEGATDASKKFAVGIAAVGAAAIAMGVVAFNAYKEAEASQKKLEHAVLDVTKGTKEQLKATEDLADALERKGVLDGDNIKVGLAQLSTFGLQNETVQALGGSLADLAVNQFGVNASGEQLSDTANMIAKALNGQFGVLEKSGIRFTELQQHIIKTGTEMEKAKAINEGFAQNLKYTNEVAMMTSEGLQAHLMVQLGNIQESFGKMVSDGIKPLMLAFSQWIDSMGGADAIVAAFVEKIKALQPYFPFIAGAITGMLVPAFIAMAGAAWAAVSPLIPFAAAGAAIAAVAYLIYEAYNTNFLGFRDIVTSTIAAIMPVVQAFIDFWKLFVIEFQAAIELVRFIWETNMYGIRDTMLVVWDAIKLYFTGIWEVIKGIFKIALGILTLDWKTAWSGIKDVAKGVWDIIVANASLLWEGLKVVFKIGGDLLALAWKGIMDGVANVATSVWESIKSIFVSGINWLIEKLNTFIRAISSVGGLIEKATGAKKGSFSIGQISPLAEGGIVRATSGGTLALMGEAGHDEAVIPLDGNHGIGTTVQIVFEGNHFYGDENTLAEKLGDVIVDKLGLHMTFPRY